MAHSAATGIIKERMDFFKRSKIRGCRRYRQGVQSHRGDLQELS